MQPSVLKDSLRAISSVIIAMSPILGNAFAYPDGNRRLCQIGALLAGILLYYSTIYKDHVVQQWASLLKRRSSWIGIGIFQGLLFCSLFFKQRLPTVYADRAEWRFLATMGFWMAIFSLLLIVTFLRPTRDLNTRQSNMEGREAHALGAAIFAIGMTMALTAWLHGPASGQAMFTFGGSEIIVASCTSMGLFLSLLTVPFPWSVLSSLSFAYLLFLSTARTGLLIFLCMTLAFVIVEVMKADPTWRCRLLRAIKAFAMTFGLMAAVIFPIFTEDHRYPYYVRDGNQSLVVQRVDEFVNRFSRVLRIFVALDLLNPEKYIGRIADASRSNSEKKLGSANEIAIGFMEREERLLAYSMQPDSRFDLITRSARAAIENPGGIWPVPFEQVVKIDCYTGIPCKYPHNFLLEVTLRFGWLVGLIATCSLAFLGIILLRFLVIGGSLTSKSLTVMLACYLIMVQVTGNIEDHVLFGCLIFLWLTEILIHKRAMFPQFNFEIDVKDLEAEPVVQSSQHARGQI